MSWLNWIEIFLWYPCNQKCSFCFQKDLRYKESKFLDYEKVISIIDEWVLKWKNSIIFSWWESTIDKNILNYISYCKNKWFKDIRIHTNWLLFSDNSKLLEYYNNWITWIIISIHWYWKIHDYLVWLDWAFNKLKLSFSNISDLIKKDRSFVLDTNTVLTKYNYNSIHILFKFLSYFPITRSQIVQLYSLYLFSLDEKKWLYVSYDKFKPFISKVIENNRNVTFENFPLCKVDNDFWDYIIKRQKYDNDAYWNMWEWFEESDCTYLNSCEKCSFKSDCVWIPKDYLKVFDTEKFISY